MKESNSRKAFQMTKCHNGKKNMIDNYKVLGMRSTIGQLSLLWEQDLSRGNLNG